MPSAASLTHSTGTLSACVVGVTADRRTYGSVKLVLCAFSSSVAEMLATTLSITAPIAAPSLTMISMEQWMAQCGRISSRTFSCCVLSVPRFTAPTCGPAHPT